MKTLKILFEKIIPLKYHIPIRYFYNKLTNNFEPEMFYVLKILHKKRTFIDIGANYGYWSYFLSNYFQNVESFEPNIEVTKKIKKLNIKNMTIHNMALSDKTEEKNLYIPIINNRIDYAGSSFEAQKKRHIVKKIESKKLDDYNFHNVDLIKIDVEGHELKALHGAIITIQKNSPILIVEIEQRHLKISIYNIFKFIKSLGYEGYFLKNNKIFNLNNFNLEEDQLKNISYLNDTFKSKKYINNFIFVKKYLNNK